MEGELKGEIIQNYPHKSLPPSVFRRLRVRALDMQSTFCMTLHGPYLMMLSYKCKLSVALARLTPGIMFVTLPSLLACRRVLAYSGKASVDATLVPVILQHHTLQGAD